MHFENGGKMSARVICQFMTGLMYLHGNLIAKYNDQWDGLKSQIVVGLVQLLAERLRRS